ncbi:Polyadenylation and cleavage factor homolog 4 [Linum grandiflorum]
MSTDDHLPPQKPPPPTPIVDRFKAMLKQRALQASRFSAGNDIDGGGLADDVVELYELMLSELTFNSKPIITELTIIAGEQRDYGEGITDAICARIIEAPANQKLPSLYLVDSIVKNIGEDYARYFSSRLPEVFCEAYRQVDPSLCPSMRHLFGTWSRVFPASVLRKIEIQLRFSPEVNNQSSGLNTLRASEAPRPTHGIHVNPKYLHQLEQSTSENAGAQRLKSHGANKVLQSSNSRFPRTLSPAAERPLSSDADEFWPMNSPRRLAHGVSAAHPGIDYGLGKNGDRDEDADEWTRKRYLDDRHRFESSSMHRMSNGHEHLDPRALIDAYGDDRAKRNVNINHGQRDRLNVNGMGNNLAPRSWQNTEEDEFDWEDINPSLSNHNRSRSNVRGSLIYQMQSQGKVDSSSIAEELYPTANKNPSIGSMAPRDVLNVPHHLSQSTHLLNDRESLATHVDKFPDTEGSWPALNMHKSNLSGQPIFSSQRQNRNQFDRMNPNNSESQHQYNSFDSRGPGLMKQPFLPQFRPPLEVRESFPQSSMASMPPHSLTRPSSHGYPMQRPGGSINIGPPPQINNLLSNLHSQMGLRPPLPLGPRPASQMMPNPPNSGPGGPFSGLINSLMSQGFISLTNQTPVQGSLGLEFDADLLKVRHESAISAFYGDLPRQCKTCGLRFKCQEEHSSHMDWHVTRNRTSKSRKQKPSRKWFVSASMWLTGAEALGTDAVPSFLTSEVVVEKKDDEELAVPADEDQNECALCGERFDDFFSDETEEWMYKGAVYLNCPHGSTAGMDRSQLGPIVHAKCRSESSVAPPEDLRQAEGGNIEEGSLRKRLRT